MKKTTQKEIDEHLEWKVKNALIREACLSSFLFFCRWVFKEIHRKQFDSPYHVLILTDIMEKVYAKEVINGVVNIPPRYYKTEIVVILFAAWSYAKNPKCNFLHVSYSDSLALKNSNAIKNIITSPPFIRLFGDIMAKEETAKQLWSTRQGGQFRATSSMSSVTGFGAGSANSEEFSGGILTDDPNKP